MVNIDTGAVGESFFRDRRRLASEGGCGSGAISRGDMGGRLPMPIVFVAMAMLLAIFSCLIDDRERELV